MIADMNYVQSDWTAFGYSARMDSMTLLLVAALLDRMDYNYD